MNSYTVRDKIENKNLEKWYDAGLNLLLIGNHGVGKSAIIKNFWDSKNIIYSMFSGATMDPWVDLIGIPKIVGRGKNARIDFARPETIDDNVEAIFIDEYNRSQASVRNAVLELIQFKSINGRHFPKLKVVWAAANPPDTDNNYDVENIDPAQEDRFHIIVKLSGKPDLDYFKSKYGNEIADGAIKWHSNLPQELKSLISPRRLDYAVDYVVNHDGEARDVFPDDRINISGFTKSIRGNKKLRELLTLQAQNNEKGISEFFKSQANVQPCLKDIVDSYDLSNLFIKYGDTEQIIAFANSEEPFSILVHREYFKNDRIKQAIDAFRAIHNQNPIWFDSAARVSLASRAALEQFLEYKDSFTNTRTEIKIGNLTTLLAFKSIEEIIDETPVFDSASLYTMDEESAKNVLDLFSKINIKEFNERNADTPWIKKSQSLIYSAFNYFYLRDANLDGASFASKGCEKSVGQPPFVLRSAGAGSRARGGQLSVREEDLS